MIPSKGASVQSPHVCVSREVHTCYHCNSEWISPRLRQSAVEESSDVVLLIDVVSPYRCCSTLHRYCFTIPIFVTHTHTHITRTGEIPSCRLVRHQYMVFYLADLAAAAAPLSLLCVGQIDFSRVH